MISIDIKLSLEFYYISIFLCKKLKWKDENLLLLILSKLDTSSINRLTYMINMLYLYWASLDY
jgi:hypothetical protein